MDPAAVYDHILSLKDEEKTAFEDELYHTLGISYDCLLLDFDHYYSGAVSKILPKEKVRVQPDISVDILNITRFLNINNDETEEESETEDDDTTMNTDALTESTDYPITSNVVCLLGAPTPEPECKQPSNDEPAHIESTGDILPQPMTTCCDEQLHPASDNPTSSENMESTPVYVNSITNNFSTMVINNVVNTAYVTNNSKFGCYESELRRRSSLSINQPKLCSGTLTPDEIDLRRRLQRFRHCGSEEDRTIAEHFITHAIFHENLLDYPYLRVSTKTGTIYDVVLRLQRAFQKDRRRLKDSGTFKIKSVKVHVKKQQERERLARKRVKLKEEDKDQSKAVACYSL